MEERSLDKAKAPGSNPGRGTKKMYPIKETDKKCAVCGAIAKWVEPRFSYYLCDSQKCKDTPPVNVNKRVQ